MWVNCWRKVCQGEGDENLQIMVNLLKESLLVGDGEVVDFHEA